MYKEAEKFDFRNPTTKEIQMKSIPIAAALVLAFASASSFAAAPASPPLREFVDVAHVVSVGPTKGCPAADVEAVKCAGLLPFLLTFEYKDRLYEQYVQQMPVGDTVKVRAGWKLTHVGVPGNPAREPALRLARVFATE